MKMEFSSQRREMLLFLTTNMAAVTSRANQQLIGDHTLLPIICNLLTCVTWRHAIHYAKTLSYIIHVQPRNIAPEKLLGCLASSFIPNIREKLSLIGHAVKQNLL